ncbi:MAG: amidohydrolase family protein, partial [Methanoculleus sp.]|nr:amidohydrolase family protein [Methanoculleus sp.]
IVREDIPEDAGSLLLHRFGLSEHRAHLVLQVDHPVEVCVLRLVAFHAGEKNPDDIDEALTFEPDLLVHCTHATDAQLRRIVDMDIPVAVCPRSNWLLGVAASPAHPPIARILELGGRFYLGTDNVMFVQPDLFQEMAFTATVYRAPPADVLRAAVSGAGLAGRPGYLEEGQEAHLLVLNPEKGNLSFSKDIRATVVKRLDSSFVDQTVLTTQ